ncbi:MAG TPA: class I SAM-dependent methyltransferase [Thermoanaerobaculia bacterium]|nr:class I SAM-dependent methyltransferase [Thermoanaerobaculia bacterium]
MREVSSLVEAIAGYFHPRGKTVVDVGCGSGETARWLASRGARAIGIDRAEVLATAVAPPARDEGFIASTGELLPIASSRADVVLYVASLHHIPPARMDEALCECRRVLGEGGRAIVIEPLFRRGSYAEITRLVEDEREVQRLAYAAVLRAATDGFAMALEETFYVPRSFTDYQTLVDTFATDADQRGEILARARALTARRAAAAGVPFDAYRWRSTCRANVLVTRDGRA